MSEEEVVIICPECGSDMYNHDSVDVSLQKCTSIPCSHEGQYFTDDKDVKTRSKLTE